MTSRRSGLYLGQRYLLRCQHPQILRIRFRTKWQGVGSLTRWLPDSQCQQGDVSADYGTFDQFRTSPHAAVGCSRLAPSVLRISLTPAARECASDDQFVKSPQMALTGPAIRADECPLLG